jgi:hypothetical protein
MLPYPEVPNIANSFTDLGFVGVSPNVIETWSALRMQHQKSTDYFNGSIFEKRVDGEIGDAPQVPLLYPLSLNLVKMMTLALTDSFVGEVDDNDAAVVFTPASYIEVTEKAKKVTEFCNGILRQSKNASLVWELDFDRNLYGGTVLRVMPDFSSPYFITWRKVVMDAFYPIFDPEDPDVILECWLANYLYPEQAREKYGYDEHVAMGYVLRTEHWTRTKHEIRINGTLVVDERNPWGIVPFVYIPRIRTTTPFGDSLVKDIFGTQDEINMRLADAGEALNYNLHPTRWGLNLPSTFSDKNYPVAADAMWDLGRAMNKDMKPEVGILSVDNPIPEGLFKYVQFVYDWARTSVAAPPIAFGEDNGGGQRSGITLEIRLWPMLKAMRTSRSFMATGLARALKISGMILKQKKLTDVPAYIYDAMINGEISARFHRVMPRDQAAAVDEVVKLLSTKTGPAISLETAQEVLGRGPAELKRILSFMGDLESQELWPFTPEPETPFGNSSTPEA